MVHCGGKEGWRGELVVGGTKPPTLSVIMGGAMTLTKWLFAAGLAGISGAGGCVVVPDGLHASLFVVFSQYARGRQEVCRPR